MTATPGKQQNSSQVSTKARDGGEAASAAGAQPASAPASVEWLSEQLERALQEIGGLQREVQHVQTGLAAQHEQVTAFFEQVRILDGRTLRHDSGYDLARAAASEVAKWGERLDAESSLRRHMAAQLERVARRESESKETLRQELAAANDRLAQLEEWRTAEEERRRRLAAAIADSGSDAEDLEARIEALELRVEADREGVRHSIEEADRQVAPLMALPGMLDDLVERVRALADDQRRLGEGLAVLRTIRDREAELLDAIEQMRATRARNEERLSAMQERVENVLRGATDSGDERARIMRSIAAIDVRVQAVEQRLQEQRDLVVAHLRREATALEHDARVRREQVDREVRTARQLLQRFVEESEGMAPASDGGEPEERK